MKQLLLWINSNGILIGIISTFFWSVVGVLLNNYFSSKPYSCYLTPQIKSGTFDDWNFAIHNAGPGTAANIKINVMQVDMAIPYKKKEQIKILKKAKSVTINGPVEIKPHEEGICSFISDI